MHGVHGTYMKYIVRNYMVYTDCTYMEYIEGVQCKVHPY